MGAAKGDIRPLCSVAPSVKIEKEARTERKPYKTCAIRRREACSREHRPATSEPRADSNLEGAIASGAGACESESQHTPHEIRCPAWLRLEGEESVATNRKGGKQCRWTIRSDPLSSPTFLTQHPKGTLCLLAYSCSWPRTLTLSATQNIEQIDDSRRRQAAIGPPISIINVKARLNIDVFFRRYFSNR